MLPFLFSVTREDYTRTLSCNTCSSQQNPKNYLLYSMYSDLDSFILYNEESIQEEVSHLEVELSKKEEIKFEPRKP